MVNPNLLTSVLITMLYSSGSDVQASDVSLIEHVKKLDEMLAEVQSHSRAQEQKNSAVLSSILSKLTQTTDKLENLETSYNETLQNLEEKNAELSNLWESYNETVSELHELRAKHNNVVVDLEKTMSKLEDMEKRPNPNGNIGFHGQLSKAKNVTANKPIFFNKVSYNSGESYNKTTGKFLVPINGTYQIWIDFTYRHHEEHGGFLVKKDTLTIEHSYGGISDEHESTSTTGIYYLQQGETIWVTATQFYHLDYYYCNFGIVLLNAH